MIEVAHFENTELILSKAGYLREFIESESRLNEGKPTVNQKDGDLVYDKVRR